MNRTKPLLLALGVIVGGCGSNEIRIVCDKGRVEIVVKDPLASKRTTIDADLIRVACEEARR